MVREYRADNFVGAVSAIANPMSGLGTLRDPTQHSTVNTVKRLSYSQIDNLFRSSPECEKAIALLPQAAIRGWVDWSLGETDTPPQAIDSYLDELGIPGAIERAAIQGRMYGDAYVLLGINDGKHWTQPVDEKYIQSIEWGAVLDNTQVNPDYTFAEDDYAEPDYYRVYVSGQKLREQFQKLGVDSRVHRSRVLRFSGKRLYGNALRNMAGEHDSILQSMYDAFNHWSLAIGASSAALQEQGIFSYKLKGLAKLSNPENPDGQEALMKRFMTIQMGKSVLKGLMMDADDEDASFIGRNYAGVTEILTKLEERLAGAAGMPPSKLFGAPKHGGMSESGTSDRYEWAACVANYESSDLEAPLKQVLRYTLLAKDGPTKGVLPDQYGFEFRSVLELTRQEMAQLRYQNMQHDAIALNKGILHASEVRQSRFGGKYSDEITLDEAMEEELFPKDEPSDANPAINEEKVEPTDKEEGVDPELKQIREDAIAGLIPHSVYLNAAGYRTDSYEFSHNRLVKMLRTDAVTGLIPRSLYLDAAGYNTSKIEALFEDELEKDSGAIAPDKLGDWYHDDEWRDDDCLRDERGRFAGGYCGGGRKGGGGGKGGGKSKGSGKKLSELQARAKELGIDPKSLRGGGRGKATLEKAIKAQEQGKDLRKAGVLKPQKVETALAKKRREAKEARNGELAPSTVKAKQRKERIEKVSQEADLARRKLEILGRQYSQPYNKLTAEEAKIVGGRPGQQLRVKFNELDAARKNSDRLQNELDSLGGKLKLETFRPGRPLSQKQIEKPLSFAEKKRMENMSELPSPRQYPRMSRERAAVDALHAGYRSARQEAPDITVAEFRSIRSYTKGSYARDSEGRIYGYIGPNAAARGLFQNPNSQVARDSTSQARLIHSALGRLPAWEGKVRRDTQMPRSQSNYKEGDRVTFAGVTSTTRDLSGRATAAYGKQGQTSLLTARESKKAGDYDRIAADIGVRTIPNSDRRRVQYVMDVKTGRDISKLSAASPEQEIALRHGWSGRVTRTRELADGTMVVYVTEE